MLKRIIIKIWKDPVCSKLISGGITALITLLCNLFYSINKNISFKDSFINFWTTEIELWVIIFFTILVIAIYYLRKNQFKYTPESLIIDRKLFNDIRNKSGILDLFLEIKTNGFSSRPVESERIEAMVDLLEESRNPDFEFLNPQLNKLKDKVILELQNLDDIMGRYIFGANNGRVAIPSEWEFEQPERMKEAKKNIAIQENIFTEAYQEFISKGRQILKL